MTARCIDRTNAAIVLIDVQPWFLERMHGDSEPLLVRLEQLLLVAEWFELPVLAVLEEPIDRKGELPERLQKFFPEIGQLHRKQTYDLTAESEIAETLRQIDRRQWIVAGGETDVCVLASVLGLLRAGHEVFLLEDCLYSSAANVEQAVYRMRNSGAIPCTYKTLFYELCGTDDPQRWASQQKAAEDRGWVPPESLPER